MPTKGELFRFRLWCNTDNKYKYQWGETEPSLCPDGHLVSETKTSIVQSLKSYKIDFSDSPYNYRKWHLTVDTSLGSVTINLKPISRVEGDILIVKTSANNSIIVNPSTSSSNQIDGLSSKTITNIGSVIFRGEDDNWTTTSDYLTDITVPVDNELPDSTTVKGDILVDNGTDMTPFPIGPDGFYLKANSSREQGVAWTDLYNESATITNKTLIDANTYLASNTSPANMVKLNLDQISGNNTRVWSFPDNSDSFVGINTSQSLTNKTFQDSTTYIRETSDETKRFKFNLSSLSSGETRTLTVPDSSMTLVGTDTTQTLTNKTMGSTLNMNNNLVSNLSNPVSNNDAANKFYVDQVAQGLTVKAPVRVATVVGAILASGFSAGSYVDGVELSIGDRILVKNQSDQTENGIYIVGISEVAPTRSPDCPVGSKASGIFVFVQEGAINQDSGWVCTTDSPDDQVSIGSLVFSQFSGAGQIIAGDGISKSGNTLDVDLKTDGGLTFESGQLSVNLGASNITGTLSVVDGGTGAVFHNAGKFLQGNDTSPVSATKTVPTGDVVGTTDAQTLSNKSLVSTNIQDSVDSSKKIVLDVSNVSTGTTRTLVVPDANLTIVGLSTTQTLTNKTIDATNNTLLNITNDSIKTGAAIDASKIASGSVSNTVFNNLSSLDKDIATKFSEHIPYSETNLVKLENSAPGSSDHLKFQLTKNSDGADTYNLGVSNTPVKMIISTEDGIYRQAAVFSSDETGTKTVFGISSSGDSGSSWNPRLTVTQSGNVGISTKDPAYTLDVNGSTNITGHLTITGNVDGRDISSDGTALDSHIAATGGVHGISGDVVGTTDVQTLSNKTMGDNLDLGNNRIVNLATPVSNNDAASKAYVDSVALGLSVKNSVRIATVAPGTLSTGFANGETIDGVVLSTGDRILIKNQTDLVENGIYIVKASGAPERSSDFAIASRASGVFVFVEEGTVNADSGWICSTDAPDDLIGTDFIVFTQFSGAGQVTAGDGLSKTGNQLDVDLKPNGGLVIQSGQIAIDLDASQISGTLAVGDGGTGATSFTSGNFLQGNGSGAVTAGKVAPLGTVVGTSDTQTLTNKTINALNNTITGLDKTYVGLSNIENLKVNLVATSNPIALNDIGEGYSVGSTWINVSNGQVFKCVDSTSSLAIWKRLEQPYCPSDSISINKGSDPFFSVKSSVYISCRTFIYKGASPGSPLPTAIKAVLKIDSNSTKAKIKIVDITNDKNIAEATGLGTADTMTIETLGTLGNLSETEAIWEIQVGGVNASNYVYLYNVTLYWGG